MNSRIVKAFVFNHTVLGLWIGACFLVTILDLFLDSSRAKVTHFSAVEVARSNAQMISQLSQENISPDIIPSLNEKLKENKLPLQIKLFNENSLEGDFQKNAFKALTKNPSEPFFTDEDAPISLLRCAVKNGWGFVEIDVFLTELDSVADNESTKTLIVIITLAALASISLSIFLGYFRFSTELLLETQQKALDYQKQLTASYERFFPHEFLSLLDKKTVLEIQLGDQKEKQMAVLFSDIRDFTGHLEKISVADSFKFINNYLFRVCPIIRKNNGFIDKYLGDAIMALFSQPDDALKAMLEVIRLQGEIVKTAQHPSDVVNEIGGSMHFGPLMVGTVGEKERMDGTVIGDVVNTASRLESLNKAYGTHILISEDFLNQLTSKEKFKIRFVDHIYMVGKQTGVKIFEVFEADPPETIAKKEQISGDFEKAMECYRNKKFAEALALLRNCQKIYPEDAITALYIQRTEGLIAQPPAENWSPISKLSHKDTL